MKYTRNTLSDEDRWAITVTIKFVLKSFLFFITNIGICRVAMPIVIKILFLFVTSGYLLHEALKISKKQKEFDARREKQQKEFDARREKQQKEFDARREKQHQ